MNTATTNDSSDSDDSSLVTPKLRFPQFRDQRGWRLSKLGEQSTILKGKGISKADLDANGPQPCIRYGELYTRYGDVITSVVSRTSVPTADLFLSKSNDVIVPCSGETKIDIATASCVLVDDVALGGDLNVIRSTLSGPFLSYYLNGPKKRDIAMVAQGDTVVHLYPYQLEAQIIGIPSYSEQRKIAECLSTLDELIGAESQKLDALKAHKKGLMQQLLPGKGENIPKLRFPKFRTSAPWKNKKIADLVTKKSLPIAVNQGEFYREIGVRSHGRGIFHKERISGAALGEKRVFSVVEGALVVINAAIKYLLEYGHEQTRWPEAF